MIKDKLIFKVKDVAAIITSVPRRINELPEVTAILDVPPRVR
jgi:hypothetical protein